MSLNFLSTLVPQHTHTHTRSHTKHRAKGEQDRDSWSFGSVLERSNSPVTGRVYVAHDNLVNFIILTAATLIEAPFDTKMKFSFVPARADGIIANMAKEISASARIIQRAPKLHGAFVNRQTNITQTE